MTDEDIRQLAMEYGIFRVPVELVRAFARAIEKATIVRCAKVCFDYEASEHSNECGDAIRGHWPDQIAHRLAAAISALIDADDGGDVGEGTNKPIPYPVAAAILIDGRIHSLPPPNRHHNIIHMMGEQSNGLIVARGVQGFLMSNGAFATRTEAADAAIAVGLIQGLQHPPLLYSEDLW